MKSSRWLIAAVFCLAPGLWAVLAYCHGNSGLAFSLPVSASKLTLDVTTMGAPVLIGVPLVLLGAILMIVAFLLAIVEQFRPTVRTAAPPEPPSRKDIPFEP